MDQQPGQEQRGTAPQYSPDGKWWWDGSRWVPAQQSPVTPPGAPIPPSRRASRWPWFVGGAVALVVLLGVCVAAVGNSGGSKPQGQVTTTSAKTTATTASKATSAPTATAATRDGSCSPQPCANDNYGWIVTISDVKYDAPSGNDFEHPESGNVYVTMNVTFTNRTQNEQHANPTEFVLLDAAGIKHTITVMDACPTWDPVNLTTGATLGPKCLAFEATAGKPTGLVLVWTPSLLGGDYNIKLN